VPWRHAFHPVLPEKTTHGSAAQAGARGVSGDASLPGFQLLDFVGSSSRDASLRAVAAKALLVVGGTLPNILGLIIIHSGL